MSTSYSAYAIIGIQIPIEKLQGEPVLQKIGKHDFPETVKFHPETGKKLWERVETYIDGFDPFEENEEEWLGFQLFKTWKGYHDSIESIILAVVATDFDGDETCNFADIDNVAELKEAMKQKLEPLGLWDDDMFGMYSYLQIC